MKKGHASRTAEYMALFRALESARPAGSRLFEDPLARHFLAPALALVARASTLPAVGSLNLLRSTQPESPTITAIAIGATAAAIVAAPPGIALLLAPAGALVATASVSVAVGGAALAGFGLENVIRLVNLQTGSTLPTPNQLLRRDIFPVLPSMRTGGPLDRTARR